MEEPGEPAQRDLPSTGDVTKLWKFFPQIKLKPTVQPLCQKRFLVTSAFTFRNLEHNRFFNQIFSGESIFICTVI